MCAFKLRANEHKLQYRRLKTLQLLIKFFFLFRRNKPLCFSSVLFSINCAGFKRKLKMSRQLINYGHLNVKKTLFMLCDIQDAFRPGMKLFDAMVTNAQKLVKPKRQSLFCIKCFDAKFANF